MNTNQPGGMPPDIHQLAGEYVLGTLPAARRREVQARLKHDPQLLAAVLVGRLAEPAPETRFMVVLVAPDDKAPGWVVQAGASGARQVELIPLGAVEVPPDKALQFWTKADGWGAPVSLGLVTPGKTLRVPAGRLPAVQPDQLFELTLEPRSGSPTGRPTGPVRYIGRAVKVM